MTSLPARSVHSLYPLALAEGEGVGTAYEYVAKRLILAGWLAERPRPARILVAGLPQKYGTSLDFCLLAGELGAELVVADERPLALEKFRRALVAAQDEGHLAGGRLATVRPLSVRVVDLATLSDLAGARFDLALSSEVLQRLGGRERPLYLRRLRGLADRLALFAPNGDNAAHTSISGLAGVTLSEMEALAQVVASRPVRCGYIDMPPFPPGITRDENQRERAESGRLEAAAMWGLDVYARLERFVPGALRRRQSHIVYALVETRTTDERGSDWRKES